MEIAIPLLTFVVMLVAGIPVAWTMALTGILGILLVTGNPAGVWGAMETIPVVQGTSFNLITIPLFVFLAYIVQNARLSDDLFSAVAAWLGRLPGGLAISSVFSGAVFGAMSGTSVASATVLSRMAVPAMDRYGYSRALATGSVAAGSTLSTLIPPSVILIVYGIATETSIGQLLQAGIIPGVVLALLLSAAIIVTVKLRPAMAPPVDGVSWGVRVRSLTKVLPVLALIVTLLVLLYTGITSPTEAAGVGAFIALVLGFSMRRLRWRDVVDAATETIKVTVMIFALFIGAGLFGNFLTVARVPQDVVAWADGLGLGPVGILVIVALIFLVGCMVMDEMPFLLLTLPVTFPLMIGAGFDPVWYGVFAVLMLNIGLMSPPIGMITFIVAGITKTPLRTAFAGAGIMIVASLVATVAIAVFPDMVLWLPSLLNT